MRACGHRLLIHASCAAISGKRAVTTGSKSLRPCPEKKGGILSRFVSAVNAEANISFAERPLEAHFAVRAWSDAYAVAEVDQAKDGLQLVVAVRSQAEHVQEKIQLSRRRVPGHCHREMMSRSSIPG